MPKPGQTDPEAIDPADPAAAADPEAPGASGGAGDSEPTLDDLMSRAFGAEPQAAEGLAADPDPDAAADPDDEDEPEPGDESEEGEERGALDERAQKALDRRIAREVRKRHDLARQLDEARDRLAALEREVEEARSTARRVKADGLADDALGALSPEELEQEQDYWSRVEDFCLKNLGRDVEEAERVYTAEQVSERLLAARRRLRALPRAMSVARDRDRSMAEVPKIYPHLARRLADVQAVLREFPAFAARADGPLLAADLLVARGARERSARTGAAAPPQAGAAPAAPLGARRGSGAASGRSSSAGAGASRGLDHARIAREGVTAEDLEAHYERIFSR